MLGMPRSTPTPTDDERALVEAAQRDPTRFADLYDLYFDRVYGFLARRTHNRSDAEDLTSEVFHEALAALPRFEWRGAPFAAWLFRIAANTLADHAERSVREPNAASRAEPPPVDPVEIENHARLHRLVDRLLRAPTAEAPHDPVA